MDKIDVRINVSFNKDTSTGDLRKVEKINPILMFYG